MMIVEVTTPGGLLKHLSILELYRSRRQSVNSGISWNAETLTNKSDGFYISCIPTDYYFFFFVDGMSHFQK